MAMATPGITLDFSFLEPARIPARPPKNATRTSNKVGFVRVNSSLEGAEMGETKKYTAETNRPIPTATPRFFTDLVSNLKSLIPRLNPSPMMGPIRGEINMAPITTAVESTFKPIDAMKMEKMRIQRLNPPNSISFLMPSTVACGFARSLIENLSFKKFKIGLIMGQRVTAVPKNPDGLLLFSTK